MGTIKYRWWLEVVNRIPWTQVSCYLALVSKVYL
ncbi:unnamed protein product [Schistosoma curassoni]|uniref:Uncharacterized protein n=1 Tax=Schistosoma curassoni TaxID=6186 RepID=A0A183KPS5_9TREM|nr:unnamed protein product [Schistosoma curassoni]